MEITAQWLALWEAGELSEEVLADRVGELVASRDGARGFFVVALAGESPLLDRLSEPLLLQLRRAGEPVVDLTARNLAMSTAMVLAHGRSGDGEQQAGSRRVQARATELLRHLEPDAVRTRLETLLAAARTGAGAREAREPEESGAVNGEGRSSDSRGDSTSTSTSNSGGDGGGGGSASIRGDSDRDSASAAINHSAIQADRHFLARWGYDDEQCQAIADAIEAVAEDP